MQIIRGLQISEGQIIWAILYLHINNKVFSTIFEVTDTPGPIIPGRKHAKAMGYVQYPAIKPPDITTKSPLHKVCADTTCNFKPKMDIKNATYKSRTDIKTDIKGTTHNTKPQTNIKGKHVQEKEPSAATQEKQSRQTDEPVLPKIKWNKDLIELNDKVQRLPITKDYPERVFRCIQRCWHSTMWTLSHQTEGQLQTNTTSTEISTHSHATCIQSRIRETN